MAEELKEQQVLPIDYDKIEDKVTGAFGKKVVFAIRDLWAELVQKINPLIRDHYDKTGIIIDADGDTKIQVEESADEDKIRMDVKGVEAFLLSDAGILTLAKQSGCRAVATSPQAVNGPSDLELDSDSATHCFDTQGEFNTSNYDATVIEDGQYILVGNVAINDLDDDKELVGSFRINDTDSHARTLLQSAGANSDICFCIVDLLDLDANDFVNVRIACSQSLNSASAAGRLTFGIFKLG